MIVRKTMAETMAEQLREAVLAGAWEPGEALPTEPELAERFGVSRAVVRDATRILAAWGLVEARQGKGVYITRDQSAGFATALLLAMRREGASVWDVEQFERVLYPEAAALAARRSAFVPHEKLRVLLEDYRKAIADQVGKEPGENWFTGEVRQAWYRFLDALFAATDNKLMTYFGSAVVRIRNVRMLEGGKDTDPEEVSLRETGEILEILQAIEEGDPGKAREITREMLALPPEAEEVMRKTPVGEAARIPLDLEEFLKNRSES